MASRLTRVGLFGGSFDPIHNGHILAIGKAQETLDLAKVLYLPTAQPPHKPGERFAPALARYCMAEMALLSFPGLEVSTYELTLGRHAYTVETVEHFRRQMPNTELVLFLGADSYLELDQWRRFDELLRLVTLAVLERPGYEISSREPLWRGAKVCWLDNEPVDLSSAALRRRLALGEPVDEREVPRAVLDYCAKYDLYS